MKVAMLHNFEKSAWKSCQTISSNLLKSYQMVLKKNKPISYNYNNRMTDFEILKLAEELCNNKVTHLCIIDHKPHPGILLKYLDHFYSHNPTIARPQIIIHVFGDFTLYGKEWRLCESYLKKFVVKFLCASDRQKTLISQFIKNDEKEISVCPFPVDQNQFYFSDSIRKQQREKLHLKNSTTVFLYTGRISLQKKVFELMLDFANFLKLTQTDTVLYLAGDFDDLGNPFTGTLSKDGEFQLRFLHTLNSFNDNIKSRIRYVGNLSQEELLKYYNAADIYLSMSAHNDEDFGMSPAEALCTGLPCILSNWGGYASFNLKNQNACTLIPTEMDVVKILYDSKVLTKELFSMLAKVPELRDKREKLRIQNINAFSIDAVINILNKTLTTDSKKFKGFTPIMNHFARAFEQSVPFVKYQKTYNDLYKEVYASYLPK